MDEFDSLICDADEIGQTLYKFQVPGASLLALGKKSAEETVLSSLDATRIVKTLLQAITGIDTWKHWYNYQWSELLKGRGMSINVNSLGQINNLKSALLDEWELGLVSLLGSVIDPLSFYNSFKYVIGLSGSVNLQTQQLTSKALLGNQSYLEIPPFFGPINAEQNLKKINDKVCESQEQHIQCIIEEVIEVIKTERPVLIFAESITRLSESSSDFLLLIRRLSNIKEIASGKLLFIQTEADVKRHLPNIGKHKYVTLATRILARGADIKVDAEIKEGLHLIIGYYPNRESVYIQMLGRTARQDDKGSYSTITRTSKDFKNLNLENDVVNNISHRISDYVFLDEKLPAESQVGRQHLKAFPLFITAFRSSSSLTLQGKNISDIEEKVNQSFPKLRG